ncbi:ribosome biogenesis protein Bms1/Tsr1 [Babesia gibsoni]|uniref:Ribosome biogenesis protein Bms1/Tsr1 n=1 Tax=Babesia gibsoni TaxID=33632 RepID=A0AAD8PGN0_BABGI|nr:ribosome biogenesis protein Bms1/Tsr1 [Babesia gibsoni]
MDALTSVVSHQGHKRSKSKIKIAKKKKKDLERKGIFEKQAKHNPKAFTFSGGRNAVHRRVQHASDFEEKRLRRPRIFKSADVPPPFIVVVQGPVGVGKTTLIQSLVKLYAKRNVSSISGPITLVSSKTRRLTFVECGNSMIDMVDCCKVADLVLLMIDGSAGYEMETLEFINLMQSHGMPRVAAVVTHLEGFPNNSTLKKTKKRLKNRFWTETYDGAKMIYLNGMKYGRYKSNEILNVSRAIASQKPLVISWRQNHFYCISLRHEILDEGDKGSEHVNNGSLTIESGTKAQGESTVKASFYGYVYGARVLNKQAVHIPGAGDFIIESVTNMDDPCPLQTEGRTLKDKNRNIYAPECDVGNVLVDDDAMYIELARAKEHFTETADEEPIKSEAVKMVRELQRSEGALLSQIKSFKFNVVGDEKNSDDGSSAYEEDFEGENEDDYEEEEDDDDDEEDDTSSTDDEEDEMEPIGMNHRSGEQKGKYSSTDMNKQSDESDDSESEGYNDIGEFGSGDELSDSEIVYKTANVDIDDGDESESSESDLNGDKDASEDSEEEKEKLGYLTDDIASRVYGDVHRTTPSGVKREGPPIGKGRRNPDYAPDLKFIDFSKLEDDKFDMDWTEDDVAEMRSELFQNYTDDTEDADKADEPAVAINDPESEKAARIEEAEQKKLYNEALEFASVGNVGQFVRLTVTGLPSSFFLRYSKDKGHPIVIGGLQMGEQSAGYLQIKLRKHRWAPRVLKTNDPLLFSLGWRRFQSLPVYCMDERNQTRIKMLKYTPEHMHCLANIYGPLAPPSLAVVAIRDWSRIPQYRISATGVVVGTNQDFTIKKKLKVQGVPYKIMKNTAFIKDMFTSELEVIKCLGSRIVTTSGIRGEIKKAVDKNGAFRATFEDKILLSDIVLLKAFITVKTKRFFNPMVDYKDFRRVRTMAELRTSLGIKPDSVYEPKALISRPTRRFNAIKIPKPIIDNLPFSSRPKIYEADVDPNKVTMEHSEYEKNVANVMQRLMSIRKSRLEKRKADRDKHIAKKKLEESKRVAAAKEKTKEVRKLRYIKQGKTEAVKRAKMNLD